MVCVTLILETFEYVHLILFTSNVCLDLMSFHLSTPGGMTGCPSKLVPIRFEFPLGGFMKGHCSFPPYLPLFIFFPLIHPTHWFWHWVCQASKGLYLTLWEEGAKGPEGKSSWQKIKSKRKKPLDASPMDPRENNKRLLIKK
jgi:hypothetical protein